MNISSLKKAAAGMAMATVFLSCSKNVFDKKDLNGVDVGIWDTEGAVNLFLNKTYDLIIPQWPVAGGIHNTTDEMNSASTALLYGQLTGNEITDIYSGNNATGNRYFDIRRCSEAIEGLTNSNLAPDLKAKLKGQFYFLRALTYFNQVRLYGGIPLVLKTQDLVNDDLAVPRASTKDCIEAIVRDLDSCYALPATWPSAEQGKVVKGAAMALKGKALMYWASPQFNPGNDITRWQKAYEACKAAYDTCKAHGYALNPDFSKIFTDETAANKEPLLIRKHDAVSVNPGRGTNIEAAIRPFSEAASGTGSYRPTWNLVKMFPMKDGSLPYKADGTVNTASGYDELLYWKDRDPRLEQTLAYNGSVWALSGKGGRRQWVYQNLVEDGSNVSATGFYTKKFSIPSLSATAAVYNSNTGGGSGMDWVEMRFAEVLVNYAECANEIGNLSEAKDLVRLLRQRAGIVAGAQDYGLALASTADQMRDLILNERAVEFAMEGKRYHDLRRTKRFHLLSGTVRQGIRLTAKDPYIAGNPPANPVAGKIYLDALTPTGARNRDTININNKEVYNKIFKVDLVTLDGANSITYPQNYYFYPLPSGVVSSSYVIEQTIGWPGGTYDPLKQ
ncbi:RagB/SusD family nutrient uptake outer membrane protein [Paraflavisolibacter sp. H34]